MGHPSGCKSDASGADEEGRPPTVLLGIEYIEDRRFKLLKTCVSISIGVATGLLIFLTYSKWGMSLSWLAWAVPRINMGVGAPCMAALLGATLPSARRGWAAHRQGAAWHPRRRRMAALAAVDVALQFCNLALFIAPNAQVVAQPCAWILVSTHVLTFLQLTIANTLFTTALCEADMLMPAEHMRDRLRRVPKLLPKLAPEAPEQLVVDLPLWVHLPKVLIFWLPTQIALLVLVLYSVGALGVLPTCYTIEACGVQYCADFKDINALAEDSLDSIVATSAVATGLLLAQVLAFFVILQLAHRYLAKRPYLPYRFPNMGLKWQVRVRLFAAVCYLLTLVCLWYVDIGSVESYILTLLGASPLQLALTSVVVANAIMCSPSASPSAAARFERRAARQRFIWLESQMEAAPPCAAAEPLPAKAAAAEPAAEPTAALHSVQSDLCSATLWQSFPSAPGVKQAPAAPAPTKQPVFCFETCLKAYVWSSLVYEVEPPQGPGAPAGEEEPHFAQALPPWMSLDTALGLYRLNGGYEMIWERRLDSRCLLAWGDGTVVLSFRGTASMANVLADLQVWRLAHHPERGVYWLGTRPMVHAGFQQSWKADGFGDRVLRKLRQVLESGRPRRRWWVLVTGHSLGGALATLAAYDITLLCQSMPDFDVHVECLTFGCPRVGNHAFRHDYLATVSDSWDVFHPTDAVARGGKFGCLYKRSGLQVMLLQSGDIIVRPPAVEAFLSRVSISRPGLLDPCFFPQHVSFHLLAHYGRTLARVLASQMEGRAVFDGEAAAARLEQEPYVRALLAHAAAEAEAAAAADEEGAAEDARVISRLASSLASASGRAQGSAPLESASARAVLARRLEGHATLAPGAGYATLAPGEGRATLAPGEVPAQADRGPPA